MSNGLLMFYPEEVAQIVGRQDPSVLRRWYRGGWFPTPSIPSTQTPKWTRDKVRAWIENGIEKLFEDGARMPELRTYESAQNYQEGCASRYLEAIKAIRDLAVERRDKLRQNINSLEGQERLKVAAEIQRLDDEIKDLLDLYKAEKAHFEELLFEEAQPVPQSNILRVYRKVPKEPAIA